MHRYIHWSLNSTEINNWHFRYFFNQIESESTICLLVNMILKLFHEQLNSQIHKAHRAQSCMKILFFALFCKREQTRNYV